VTVHSGLYVLFRKEVADHFRSRRFIIIMLIVAVTCLAGVYSAGMGIRAAVAQENNEFVFLKLFTSSGGSLPSFATFLSFLGPLVGLSMGFDAINGERNNRTLSRLLAQPIYRDVVINAKFLAGLFILVMMVLTLGLAVAGFGIILTGIPPTGEEVARMFVYLLFTVVYIALWLAVSQLFSLLFRQTATSALACIALWLFLVVFVGLLAGIIADGIYPVSEDAPVEVVVKNYNLQHTINRLSPTLLYDEAVVTILNPGVRSLGLVFLNQIEGAVPGALSLSQSLLLVWPHVTGILAATVICFTVAYICFMRQEIRA